MKFLELFTNDLMFIFLGLMIVALGIWLYNLNNDAGNKLDLADLISEKGRISDVKLIRFGTWLVSSWGFIFLITRDALTEWYFIGFMGSWVANALISKHISTRASNEELSLTLKNAKTIRKPNENYDPQDGE